jgi:hypothetical protein
MEHLQTIQQIFSARFLRVPDYQRGYAWERHHWDDLLDDLEILALGGEHYTGTLVLHRVEGEAPIMDEEGREHGVYDVVDGQQRLTTIVLLLDAIRRESSLPPALADGLKKTYVLARGIDGQLQPKLTLNRDTHDYFMRNVIADKPGIDGPQIRSQKRLKDAHAHLRSYLSTQREQSEDPAAWIVNLIKKVTNHLKLTVYEVPSASEVGVIFEVMNNRGKPLSEMEKVKNYLLYLVSKVAGTRANELTAQINVTWREIFEGLMESELSGSSYEDQLLRVHWITVYDHASRSWSSDSVKQRFALKQYQGHAQQLVTDLTGYVSTLRAFATAYCDLIAPRRTNAFKEYSDRPAIRDGLQRAAEKLVRLDSLAPFLPVLCGARVAHPGESELYLRLLRICERYAFRVYRWAQRRANAGQTNLFKVGNDLYHRQISADDAESAIATLLLLYAPTEDFHNDLDKHDDWYDWYGIKYFLYEYEEHLAKGKAVQFPWEQLAKTDKRDSIEHILPQTPSEAYWRDRWTEETMRLRLHDIGNLTLTFDNSSYGNKPFPQKRATAASGAGYTNSNLFMERDLAAYSDWTPKECDERRRPIVAWAKTRWEVAPPAKPPVEGLVEEDEE